MNLIFMRHVKQLIMLLLLLMGNNNVSALGGTGGNSSISIGSIKTGTYVSN